MNTDATRPTNFQEWNAAVDKYINSGVDPRPRSSIEAAAKIGISLGAMYRKCQADGCDKVEGRDIEKMSTCSRCKVVRMTVIQIPWLTGKLSDVLLLTDMPEAALADA